VSAAASPENPRWRASVEEFLVLPLPFAELPEPTPSEGPDPYGSADDEWLRIDWREHSRTVEVPTGEDVYGPSPSSRRRAGSTEVCFAELGEPSGLDLVFVHGLSGSWQNWLENLPHFARRHRVLALDLPGFGSSPLPPWEISIERYGRFLHDFCSAVGVRDCAVVGNSMGGFIAAEAASREPDRFEKLVLVSAAGVSHARARREPGEVAARMGAASAPLLLRLSDAAMRRPRVRWSAFRQLVHFPLRLRPELLYEQFHNGAGKPAFPHAMRALLGYDILDRLEEVEVPTLIVWGRNDRIVPAADASEYGRRLRNSRTVIFDRTGHVPQLERPERFNRVLEEFLAES
jgi:pimeloyl-ACP methyl ester carboxylesterase